MSNPQMINRLSAKSGKILFLFSDTGGGYRSAAEALIEALHLEFGSQIVTDVVDVFRDYAPLPFNKMPEFYPEMMRYPELWKIGFRLSNGRRRARLLQASAWSYICRALRELIRQHPADVIVSVHPLANTPVLRALGAQRRTFVTVVTDLVSGHMFWYDRRADLCIVPMQDARQRALQAGLKPAQVEVIGLPAADCFCQASDSTRVLRQKLAWRQGLPVVLLVGGGDGKGLIEATVRALNAARLPVAVAVVTGRNVGLKARLESKRWLLPVQVYGFVHEMPEFMHAADILLTKAGPGTICEALNAGLPMVLYSRLPGQEDGNILYITDHGAGIWAPSPVQVVAAVRNWLDHPEKHMQARQACLRLARPRAARQIAQRLAEMIPARIGQIRRLPKVSPLACF